MPVQYWTILQLQYLRKYYGKHLKPLCRLVNSLSSNLPGLRNCCIIVAIVNLLSWLFRTLISSFCFASNTMNLSEDDVAGARPPHKPSPMKAPGRSAPSNDVKTDEPLHLDSIGRAFAPPIGSRIQVLWRIVYSELGSTSNTPRKLQVLEQQSQFHQSMPTETVVPNEPDVVERWWGAVVQDCTTDLVGLRDPTHSEYNVFVLLYDSYGEFEEETSRVAFLPGNVLLDLSMIHDEEGGRLDWRLESSNLDVETLPTHSVSPLRTTELSQFADDLASQSDIPADADLRALATMPYNVQLHVTSGYRSFADSLKSRLGQLLSTKPPDYVVTADDIRDVMSRVRGDQRRRDSTLPASDHM